MHTSSRNGASIDRIYLHTNEGPQVEGGAIALSKYLDSPGVDAGYHVIVDDKRTVRQVGDDAVVWAEGGDNTHALSVVMIGRAAQDWTTPYSKAEIERAAQQVAVWCKQYGVPEVHVRPGAPGHAPTGRGIAEHADDHDPRSEGHTDPGTGFPIAAFIERVQEINAPPIDWHAIQELAAWKQRVSNNPLHADADPENPARPLDTQTLRSLLARRGYNVTPCTVYGPRTSAAVRQFKIDEKLPNHDGDSFGALAADAILS